MTQVLEAKLTELEAVARTKPIMIAELATSPNGGDEAAWITTGYSKLYAHHPRVKVVVYFNIDGKTQAGQEDWRLRGASLRAYRKLLTQTKFRGVIP